MRRLRKPFRLFRGFRSAAGNVCFTLDFLTALFRRVKAAGKTCLLIDSNGVIDFGQYPQLLALCDGVMLDMKAIDDDFHRQLTGASNRQVLDNLTLLLEAGKLEEARTVLLPQFPKQNQKTVRAVNERLQGKIRYKLLSAIGRLGCARKDCGSAAGRSRRWKKPSVLAQAESDRGFHNCVVI